MFCLRGFPGILCGCGDCDACTVVCVACEYGERMRGNDTVGVGDEEVRVVHVVLVLSSAADMLGMSVVRGMKGVDGMCMCLARDGVDVGTEWIRGLALDFNNPVGTG